MDESCTTSYSDNSSSNSSQLKNSQIILSTNLILPLPADEERRNLSKKYQFQVHEKSELKRIKILRFTSRAFAGGCFCCCSHAGQPGAVLQHCYTAAQTIKKSFTGKNLDVFQTKPLKLAATRCARTSRTRFPSCHAYQFRVVVEIWNFGGVELVGGVSSVGNCWARQQQRQQQQQHRRHSCENGALSATSASAGRHGS